MRLRSGPLGETYAFLAASTDTWAKCEFVSAVAEQRLDRLRRNGVYFTPRLREGDLRAIRIAVLRAVGASLL